MLTDHEYAVLKPLYPDKLMELPANGLTMVAAVMDPDFRAVLQTRAISYLHLQSRGLVEVSATKNASYAVGLTGAGRRAIYQYRDLRLGVLPPERNARGQDNENR